MKIYKMDSLQHFQQYIILQAKKRLKNWKIRPSGKYSRCLLSCAMDNLKIILAMLPFWDKTYMENILQEYEHLALPLSELRGKTSFVYKKLAISQVGDASQFISLDLCLACLFHFKMKIKEYEEKTKNFPKLIHDFGDSFQ